MHFFRNKKLSHSPKESITTPVELKQTTFTEPDYIYKTELGQKLMQIRREAIAEGMQLKSVEELNREFNDWQ